MRIVLPIVALLLGQSLSLPAAMPTPFKLAPQGGIIVPVMVNGAGPFRVLLDTGANHSSISPEVAETLSARAVARGVVATSAGDRECLIVQLERVTLGPIDVTARATVVPSRDLRAAGDIDGVLGQDVLSGLTYTIDYRQRRIVWDDHRDPVSNGAATVLPLAFREGLPMVELAQDNAMLHLVADSGAGGLVLFDGAGRDLPAMTPDGGQVRVDTFHGSTMATSVRIDRFRVGVSTFRNFPAVLLQRPPAPERGDGLLPLHIFDRVTFDGPGRRLILG